MNPIEHLHERFVRRRRVDVLSHHLAAMLRPSAAVLDVGCGDGQIAAAILAKRSDVSIEGVDVLIRPDTAISVRQFDGTTLPYADNSFDQVTFSDVLHHIEDPMPVLREAVRVARHGLVIKDHTREGWLAGRRLRFMDDVGNARHGVPVPANYWTRAQWAAAWQALGLKATEERVRLGLYPFPISLLFDGQLHMVGRYEPVG